MLNSLNAVQIIKNIIDWFLIWCSMAWNLNPYEVLGASDSATPVNCVTELF